MAVRHNKRYSAIDREMNKRLKHAKSATEIMAIKAEARENRRRVDAKQVEKEKEDSTIITFDISNHLASLMPQFAVWPSGMPVNKGVRFFTYDAPVKPPPIDAAKLEALKSVEPHKVPHRAPDLVEVITAWRAWRVIGRAGNWRLVALGKGHLWEPKEQVSAVCDRSMRGFGMYPSVTHPAPDMDCECGVWAFKELDGLVSALANYSSLRVLGKVSLWGRVIETENGYRSQYAYPSELWLLDSSLEELGLIYDVPVRMVAE